MAECSSGKCSRPEVDHLNIVYDRQFGQRSRKINHRNVWNNWIEAKNKSPPIQCWWMFRLKMKISDQHMCTHNIIPYIRNL